MNYLYINICKAALYALLSFVLICGYSANAASTSRPLPVDHRVHTISYQPDQVYKWSGYYRYQSAIEFEPGEKIETISMGDSTGWMLNPSGHRLFLKPIAQDATTNMTLITDRRVYLFELHAKETDNINDPDMVFVMRFKYNNSGNNTFGNYNYLDSVPEPDFENEPDKYNANYTISGSEFIAPIRIFDDGEFTYFEFRDKNAEVPAFFWVDDENNESIINYRTRGDYIVVERVSGRFTLRHGKEIVCVFNEKELAKPKLIKR
ncbi:MAG: P-type conjugative transfer protein VirB9 [Rickettsiales bacterium]